MNGPFLSLSSWIFLLDSWMRDGSGQITSPLKFFSSLILGIIIQYCSLSFLPPYIYIYPSYCCSSLWPPFSLIVEYIYVHVHKYTFLKTICLIFIMLLVYVFMVVPWVLGNHNTQVGGLPSERLFLALPAFLPWLEFFRAETSWASPVHFDVFIGNQTTFS